MGESVPVYNTTSGIIPRFALMRRTGVNANAQVTVAKPDTDGQLVLVNGPIAILPLSVGLAAGYGNRAIIAYEPTDGTPANGETWGAGAGSWLARKDNDGFEIDGGAYDGAVNAVRFMAAGFPAQLTSTYDGTTGYDWKRLELDLGTPGFDDASPTVTGSDAFDVTGDETLPSGTRVLMWPATGGGYEFQAPAGDTGSTASVLLILGRVTAVSGTGGYIHTVRRVEASGDTPFEYTDVAGPVEYTGCYCTLRVYDGYSDYSSLPIGTIVSVHEKQDTGYWITPVSGSTLDRPGLLTETEQRIGGRKFFRKETVINESQTTGNVFDVMDAWSGEFTDGTYAIRVWTAATYTDHRDRTFNLWEPGDNDYPGTFYLNGIIWPYWSIPDADIWTSAVRILYHSDETGEIVYRDSAGAKHSLADIGVGTVPGGTDTGDLLQWNGSSWVILSASGTAGYLYWSGSAWSVATGGVSGSFVAFADMTLVGMKIVTVTNGQITGIDDPP